MAQYESIINQILDMEWYMFQRVKSAEPAACQTQPDTFRDIRRSIYATWTEEMLKAYLEDLKLARKSGRNLLTEKYARMDGIIPTINLNPLIELIVTIEEKWQKELQGRYPAVYNQVCRNIGSTQDGSNFEVYLRSELETYGDRTIELYLEHVRHAWRKGENLAVKSLQQLVRKGGYRDLDHAENCLSGKQIRISHDI